MAKQPITYRSMADREIAAAKALSKCSFLPATFAKRFARSLGEIAQSETPVISENQALNLWRLVWKYRRQIPDHLVSLAQQKLDEAGEGPSKPRPSLGDLEKLKRWRQ